jgi:flagellar hook-associated protein 1 FlgK
MSSASLLRIGVTGLMAHQAALQTAGHNISNTDTPGFSRQSVSLGTQSPDFSGSGYQGTGVRVDEIRRVVDDFSVSQLRLDTSAFNKLDTYLSNISQIDGLLADVSTGLAPGIQDFFAALHAGADDPTSVPVRQLVVSQAEGLTDRFATIQSRLTQHNNTVNLQLETIASEITSLAKGLAGLNQSIVTATGRAQNNAPNDLLDTRDQLLKRLSALVSVNVVSTGQNAVDVFIGNGQALVVGSKANELKAIAGEADPSRKDLAFANGKVEQTVTPLITGGKLGGLIDFREQVLDTSLNTIGRLAITLATQTNEQHVLGLDLNGQFGKRFFADVNSQQSMLNRVVADKDNLSSNETRLSVEITDASQLSSSDYYLAFPGPGSDRYVLSRVDTGDVVRKGVLSGALSDSISADGITINIERGKITQGDRFLIQPTRFGSKDLVVELERPEQIAFASAVSGDASLGNGGTGRITNTEALDVSTRSFAVPGELSPPLLIQFTSEVSYDILDNSNPSRPADLIPPLRNLRFTPGIDNQLLPDSIGQTALSSSGLLSGRLPSRFTQSPTDGESNNGYVDERLTISTVNPASGVLSVQPSVQILPGEAASSVAQKLGALHGVQASANTKVFLSDFSNQQVGGFPIELIVNGVQVNNPDDPLEPGLLNPNYLADLMTSMPVFAAMGLTAKSDGDTLTLESFSGEDIKVAIRGDVDDKFTLKDVHDNELVLSGAGGSTAAVLAGTIDRSAGFNFDLGGPYTMTLKLGDGTNQTVRLAGNQILGSDVAGELQSAINNSEIASGDVIASMGTDGRISLTTRGFGESQRLEIVDVSPALNFALGFIPETAVGADIKNEVTVGGVLNVFMEDGVSLASDAVAVNGNLFRAEPEALSTYLGYQISLDGSPVAGDKFTIEFNSDGVSDNRNGLALTALETTKLVDRGSVTLADSYGRMVELIGVGTAQSQINMEASESLVQQSQSNRDSISGVNLDEEAADLIRYELGYNASAQVISIARSLFETLLNSVR